MGKKVKKVPASNQNAISVQKKPRTDPALQNPLQQNPAWRIGAVDFGGPWGWMEIERSAFMNEILSKIKDFESMTWAEILRRNNHEITLDKICKEARDRLEELRLDDFESLISLRFTGRQRVWGIKIQNVFKFLWWDPNHEVCPSRLKHT